ncbi:unnamed protein product [Closterium sp. Naga37s-1]|nr:unnamed protein product [Closterium sp. Naga37s-1]
MHDCHTRRAPVSPSAPSEASLIANTTSAAMSGASTNFGGLSEEAARVAGIKGKKSTFKEKTWVNPSRTLYITNVPPGASTEQLEGLFRHLEGFIAFRRVRSMCFVDFDEKQHATAAMWKTNGHKFKPHHDGLLVSYDKDDGEEKGGWSMRQRVEERQRKAEADLSRVLYRCAACNHFCFKLARPLSALPERRTDGSRVVEAATDLVTMMAVKGGQKLLKREKGVERQFRYNCELCDACMAYRPVPYEQDSKYIYLFPEALTESKPGQPNHSSPAAAVAAAVAAGVAVSPAVAQLRPVTVAADGLPSILGLPGMPLPAIAEDAAAAAAVPGGADAAGGAAASGDGQGGGEGEVVKGGKEGEEGKAGEEKADGNDGKGRSRQEDSRPQFVTGRRVARGREGFAASPLLSPPSPVQSQSPHRAATRDSEVRRRGAADRGLAEPAAVVRGREGYRGSAGGIGVGGALQLRSRAGSRMGAGGSSAGTDQPSSRGSGGGGGRGAARRVAIVAVVAVLALTPLLAFTSVMPPWLHAHGGAQTEGEVRGKGKVTGEGEQASLVTHAALPHTDLHTEVRCGETPTPGLSTVTAAEAAAPAADFELPWPEDSMALCLVGQLRTFELTGPSIAANLVGVEGYGQADVFVVTPLDENSAKLLALRGMGWAEGAQGAGGAREENVMQQGEAGRGGGGGLGGPRLVSVRVFPDFNVNEALYPTHALKGLENGPQGLLQQFSMEAMCAADIAERERRYSRRYKWLMKARPDSFWAAPPAPLGALEYWSLTAPPGLDFGGVNDRLAVVPRAAGRAAFARLHMLGAVSEGVGEAGKRVNAETVYARMLQRLNVTVTRAHFPLCLVSHHQFFRMLALPNLRNRRGGDYCRPCHHEPPPNPFCEQTGPWAADWAAQFDQHVPERLAAGRRAVMAAVEGGREGCEAQVAQLSLEVRRRTNPSASLTAPPARRALLTAQQQQQQASASNPAGQTSLWQHLLGRLGGRPVASGLEQGGKEEETASAAAAEEEVAEAAWREAVRREGWRAPVPAVLCVRHGLGKATVFGASGTGRGGSWSAFLQHLFALTHSIAVSLPATPPSADLLWDAHLLSALPSMRLLMLPKPPAQPTAAAAQTADAAAQQQSAAAGREVGAQYKAVFEAAVRRIKAAEEVVGRGGAAVDADHVLSAAGASKHVDLIRVGAGRLPDLQGLLARGMSTCQLLVDMEGAGEGVLAQLRGRYWEGGSGGGEGGVEGGGADVGRAGVGRMGGRRLQQVGQGAQQGEAQGGEHGVDQGGVDASGGVEELDAFLLPDDPLLAKWQGEAVLREVQRWLSGRSFHLDRCVSGNEERVGRCTFFSLTHCQAPVTTPQQTSGR